MSFDWSEYLRLAQELVGQDVRPAGQEARLRAAISRAYYAAFCEARNCLLAEGRHLSTGHDVHRAVREEFTKSSDKMRRQISQNLDRLRNDRNKADYDDRVRRLADTAVADIELSRSVLEGLARLRQVE
ncbi:MAG: HEPN domain-containing protein [Chloroflexi bacterium]|nr:HEPN domain-containing protein [Chloroflexota bacterium]